MTVSLPNFPIHVMARKKCIEVYLRNVSKATAIRRILQHHQNHVKRNASFCENDEISEPLSVENAPDLYDFIFCVGNDRADEYMFEYLRKLSKRRASLSPESTRKSLVEQASEISISESSGVDSTSMRAFSNENSKVFTCTVGSKSSAAQSYVASPVEALSILFNLLK